MIKMATSLHPVCISARGERDHGTRAVEEIGASSDNALQGAAASSSRKCEKDAWSEEQAR